MSRRRAPSLVATVKHPLVRITAGSQIHLKASRSFVPIFERNNLSRYSGSNTRYVDVLPGAKSCGSQTIYACSVTVGLSSWSDMSSYTGPLLGVSVYVVG